MSSIDTMRMGIQVCTYVQHRHHEDGSTGVYVQHRLHEDGDTGVYVQHRLHEDGDTGMYVQHRHHEDGDTGVYVQHRLHEDGDTGTSNPMGNAGNFISYLSLFSCVSSGWGGRPGCIPP